jgi:PQQ-like domain
VIRPALCALAAIALAAGCGSSGDGLAVEGTSTLAASPSRSAPAASSTGPAADGRKPCDPRSGCVERRIRIGSGAALAYDSGTLWVAAQPARGLLYGTLIRIDAVTGRRTAPPEPLPASPDPYRIASGDGGLWMAGARRIWLIDPATGQPRSTVDAGGIVTGLTISGGSVWAIAASPAGGALLRIDPADGHVLRRRRLASSPSAVTVADGSVWVADRVRQTVTQLSAPTLRFVRTIRLPRRPLWEPSQLTVVGTVLWAFDRGAAIGFSVRTGSLIYTQRFAAAPGGGDMAGGAGALWVASSRPRAGRGVVLRLDAVNGNQVGHPIVVGGRVSALATGDGSVWAMDARDGLLVQIAPGTG